MTRLPILLLAIAFTTFGEPAIAQTKKQPTKKGSGQSDQKWIHLDLSNATVMGNFLRIAPDKAVVTKQSYSGPVDISVLAKTNKDNIRLHAFKGGIVIFNWEGNRGDLRIHRPDDVNEQVGSVAVSKQIPLKADTWYTLRWKIKEDGMEVLVDGKVVFSETQKYDLSKPCPIRISGALGSVVDVQFVQIQEPVTDQKQKMAEKKAEAAAERKRQEVAREKAESKEYGDRQIAEWNKLPALPGVDGKNHSLPEYKKDVLVVCVLRNSCPVSIVHKDRIIDFTKKYDGKVDFVAIYTGSRDDDKLPKIKEEGFNFPCLYDENLATARSLGATATPHFFVFNKDRKLIYRGAMSDSYSGYGKTTTVLYLDPAVQAALKGETPSITSSQAKGCPIQGIRNK
jgi:hypothetical protein